MFPRRTNLTPTDDLSFIDVPGLFPPNVDEVHVSATWTYDLPRAEWLAAQWAHVAPVTIGGPATGQRGEAFVPGMYIGNGGVITSRGCFNKCWFCSVWKRDGTLRELPITSGWNVLDDNILATSRPHFLAVMDMLKKQPHRARFTGGLEAKLLRPWHVEHLKALNPEYVFFAYDTPDDWEPLVSAARLCAGYEWLNRHTHRCYCLIGYPDDTLEHAEFRLRRVLSLGIFPMAMLWRNERGDTDPAWRRFQREWARPAIIAGKVA